MSGLPPGLIELECVQFGMELVRMSEYLLPSSLEDPPSHDPKHQKIDIQLVGKKKKIQAQKEV